MSKGKRLLFLALFLLFLWGLTPWGIAFWKQTAIWLGTANRDTLIDGENVTLHVLSVGKADALLLEQAGQFVLIDGGTVNTAPTIEAYLMRRGVKALDAIFVTHPDSDHLGGIPYLLEKFSTKHFYTVDTSGESTEYDDMLQALQLQQVIPTYVSAGDTIGFGAVSVAVISPQKIYATSNDNSLVLQVRYGDFSALLTGDASQKVEADLLASKIALQADVLKASHHGSKTGSTQAFLEAVAPRAVVISTGPDRNRLPNSEVLARFKQLQIPYYRTDTDGVVLISSNKMGSLLISTKEKNDENIKG